MDLSHLLSFMKTPLCYPTEIVFEWVHSLAMIKRGARFFLSPFWRTLFSDMRNHYFCCGSPWKMFFFSSAFECLENRFHFFLPNLAKRFNANPVVELSKGAKWSHSGGGEYQLRPWPSQQTSRMLKGAGIHVANVETTFHVDLTACIENQGCAFSNGKSFISIVVGVSCFQFMGLAVALWHETTDRDFYRYKVCLLNYWIIVKKVKFSLRRSDTMKGCDIRAKVDNFRFVLSKSIPRVDALRNRVSAVS